jgi:TPR repeat protein
VSGVLAAQRAVLVRRDDAGGVRVGSGLRIGARLVLTADHCVGGENLRVVSGGVEYPASVVVRSDTPDVDVALVEAAGLAELGWLGLGRVDRSVAVRLVGCVALGFPHWKPRVDGQRVLVQVDGYVPTAEGIVVTGHDAVRLVTLKSEGPSVKEQPLPQGDLAAPGTPWAGMSGAVVVAGDVVVGVVARHNLAEGAGSLSVTPLDAIEGLPAARAAEFWAALGRDADGLRLLPDAAFGERLAGLSPAGRPWRVADVGDLAIFGVRKARQDVDRRGNEFFPYVAWHADTAVREGLRRRVEGTDTRVLLLVGEPMAGKSRIGAEAVRSCPGLAHRRLLIPKPGTPLDSLGGLVDAEGAVLWLDDLDRHAASLNGTVVDGWRARPGLVVVATIRRDRMAALRSDSELRAAWDVLFDDQRIERLDIDSHWDTTDQAGLVAVDPTVRDKVADGQSLGKVLAAAEELRRQLDVADPSQRALVDLTADWARTGLDTLPEPVALHLWPHYLPPPARRQLEHTHPDDVQQRFETARTWATKPVDGTGVALLRRTRDGLEVDDYVVTHRSSTGSPVGRPVWEAALERASTDPTLAWKVGLAAATGQPPETHIARRAWEPAAQAGDPDAQNSLGVLLATGADPPELDEARRWWTVAAEAGHPDAQYNLGVLLADRLDAPELDEARRWYTAAAEAGHTAAQTNLGLLLAVKLEPPELDEARHWETAAAEAGDTEAQNNLGLLLVENLNPPEHDEARRWWTAAAEKGHTDAQYNLGLLLVENLSPPEIEEARRWWTAAAEKGNTDAQYNLGVLLEDHLDSPELDEARRWYTAAAQTGQPEALAALRALSSRMGCR